MASTGSEYAPRRKERRNNVGKACAPRRHTNTSLALTMTIAPLSNTTSVYPMTTRVAEQTSSTTTRNAAPTVGDAVEISGAGKLLGRLQSLFMDGAGEDGVITLQEMQAFRDKNVNIAQDILRETTSALGLDPDATFTITRDGYGRFSVQGDVDSAEAQALGDALTANDAFQQAYAAADSTSTILAAADAHIGFAAEYAKNPQLAVSRYSWLFGADWAFGLTYDQGDVSSQVTLNSSKTEGSR